MNNETRNAYRASHLLILAGTVMMAASLLVIASTFGTEGAAELSIARLGIMFLFTSALPLFLGFRTHAKLQNAALRAAGRIR